MLLPAQPGPFGTLILMIVCCPLIRFEGAGVGMILVVESSTCVLTIATETAKRK